MPRNGLKLVFALLYLLCALQRIMKHYMLCLGCRDYASYGALSSIDVTKF